jgi:hypothetical protein
MLESPPLPAYLHLDAMAQAETVVGLDFETYRHLGRTALLIIKGVPGTMMGIYRIGDSGCGLDIWFATHCLTILIDRQANILQLACSDLDLATPTICLLNTDNSKHSWQVLLQAALANRQ